MIIWENKKVSVGPAGNTEEEFTVSEVIRALQGVHPDSVMHILTYGGYYSNWIDVSEPRVESKKEIYARELEEAMREADLAATAEKKRQDNIVKERKDAVIRINELEAELAKQRELLHNR